MNAQIPISRLVGSSLLAVIAAAAMVVGVLMAFAAWATGSQASGWLADVGTVAVLVIAVLALAYAGVAAYAAREEWLARPLGRMLGLSVAIVGVLASAVTLLMGNASESALLLYLGIGLGVATAIAMLVPEHGAE